LLRPRCGEVRCRDAPPLIIGSGKGMVMPGRPEKPCGIPAGTPSRRGEAGWHCIAEVGQRWQAGEAAKLTCEGVRRQVESVAGRAGRRGAQRRAGAAASAPLQAQHRAHYRRCGGLVLHSILHSVHRGHGSAAGSDARWQLRVMELAGMAKGTPAGGSGRSAIQSAPVVGPASPDTQPLNATTVSTATCSSPWPASLPD
jgi:hypothetical protein